jgi:Phasin protein
MAQPQSERFEKFAPFNLTAADVAAETKKRIEQFANAQTQQLDKLQAANRLWLDRIQTEANLASEFASKLSSARSLPEAMTACQDWGKRRVEMMAEDTKHILDDAQSLMQMSAQLFAKAWQGERPGASS